MLFYSEVKYHYKINKSVVSSSCVFQTSVVCKAAVHAGIILDQFGGAVTVEKHRGLRYYEPVQANGIQSKS